MTEVAEEKMPKEHYDAVVTYKRESTVRKLLQQQADKVEKKAKLEEGTEQDDPPDSIGKWIAAKIEEEQSEADSKAEISEVVSEVKQEAKGESSLVSIDL